jgi:hypothetical protein
MTYGVNLVYDSAVTKSVKSLEPWQVELAEAIRLLPAGEPKKLADFLEVNESNVSLWKSRQRPVPWKHQGKIRTFLSRSTYVQPRQTSDTKSASSTPKEQGGHADATLVAQIGDLQREYQRIRSTLFDFKDTLDRFFKGGAAGHSVNTGRSSRVGGVADPAGKKARPSGTRPKTGEGSGGRRSDE